MAPGHFEIASNFPPLHPSYSPELRFQTSPIQHPRWQELFATYQPPSAVKSSDDFFFAHQQNLATLRSPAKS